MGRGGFGPALPDQRAELRPLQNLRREGPECQYHVGSSGGRRRTQLRSHVNDHVVHDCVSTVTDRWSRYGHSAGVFRLGWIRRANLLTELSPPILAVKRQTRHCRQLLMPPLGFASEKIRNFLRSMIRKVDTGFPDHAQTKPRRTVMSS